LKYRVLLSNHAEKDLLSLPSDIIKRIDNRLRVLSSSPYPEGVAKLKGKESDGWRIRVGDYRILYQVSDREHTVRVYRIKHRRDAYH
jgi:mRNA interferase RelE/StbE